MAAFKISTILLPVGRVLLASLFILGGLNKIGNYGETVASMIDAGLPFASILLPLVIALELCGGALVAIGRTRLAPLAALALAAFTVATNFVFHEFWTMDGLEAELELSLFFKNISIAGGLLLVAGMLMRDRTRE